MNPLTPVPNRDAAAPRLLLSMPDAAPEVFASAFRQPRPPVAFVGAGAVARALALRMAEAGYPVVGVVSRTRASAQALARRVGAAVASDRLDELPPAAELVVLAVPDDQLATAAETLAGARRSWRGTVVAHCSGALGSDVLAPLAALGADVLAYHPLQAITASADADTLAGVFAGIEGGPRALAAGVELAVGLGMRYAVVPPEAKPRYHLAAAMASNLVVTLLGVVQEVLASLDVDRADAMAMLTPLLRGTLDNLAATSPEEALTGPVARGDLETLRRHGLALRQHLPHLVPVYAALSVETVRLAVRAGTLAPDRAEAVLALMQRMVTLPLPPRPSLAAPPAASAAPPRPGAGAPAAETDLAAVR